jgi:uncharacterized protein (DUF2062 family)
MFQVHNIQEVAKEIMNHVLINSLIINLTGAILMILVTYEMLTKKQKKRTEWIYYLVIYYVMCTILRV